MRILTGKKEIRPRMNSFRGNEKKWKEISDRVFSLLPYRKARKFVTEEIDKEGFTSRHLNDTRYISRRAKEILSTISERVSVFPGSVTAHLRDLWGLNSILAPSPGGYSRELF